MKTRQGFVSNSSTSSFMLHGAQVDYYFIKDMLLKNYQDDPKFKEKAGEKFEEYLEEYGVSEYEHLIDLPGKLKVFIRYCDWGDEDTIYIGRSYTSMDDDETYGEFKQSIKDELTKFLGKEVKTGHISEAWRNG